jgi:hypothetical protein
MSRDFVDMLNAAQHAYRVLGPLASYDESANGPLLGISDSGYSAELIHRAATRSAKFAAGGDAAANGLILDAERMGSGGEVPVGPGEYRMVAESALGRTWFTTNVGVRANARYLQANPELAVTDLIAPGDESLAPLKDLFAPYLKPPGGRPRPLTVYLRVDPGVALGALPGLIERVEELRGSALADAALHQVALLSVFPSAPTDREVDWIEKVIECAAGVGVPTVAVHAPAVEAAQIRVSVQGLLQILAPSAAARLLATGARLEVSVVPRFRVDTESVMRTIWAGLHTARAHGLSAAKYGLTPLTLAEQRSVIGKIQQWTKGWTAIPAFYADTPLVTDADVYLSDRVVEASLRWLEMAHEAEADLVLFDCPDRFIPRIDSSGTATGRRLLRRSPDDEEGAYSLADTEAIIARASELGVRILWSGGIQPRQAFELAKQGATGIFTTGSTARPAPVTPVLAQDPLLAAEGAPTESGVRRVHALIQAGFLISSLSGPHGDTSREIEESCGAVLSAELESDQLRAALDLLDAALAQGWPLHWARQRKADEC